MSLPTLYKRLSTGKVQEWQIAVFALEDKTAILKVIHGQMYGKKQETETKFTEGKNKGKKNETSPTEQALKEAKSKWLKQKDKGYSEDSGGISEAPIPLPMLAYSYTDYHKKVAFDDQTFYQPKLDGARSIAVKNDGAVKLWSRQGTPIETMPHIQHQLRDIMLDGDIFDGELYAHGIPFQKQISWFKKFNKDEYEKVSYHVFDLIPQEQLTFAQRYAILQTRLPVNCSTVELVETKKLSSHDHLLEVHSDLTANGYEGVIIRHGNCYYELNKRSKQLLKFKEFMDMEFEIVDAYENAGKMEGTCCFVLKTAEGRTFDCFPKGDDSIRRQYWQDFQAGLLTGKLMTVRFFAWTDTVPPVPRFPIGVGIRFDI